MSKCVFAGSFNPFTIGHADIVEKCLNMFDEVVIAFAINANKADTNKDDIGRSFTRVCQLYKDTSRVKVVYWAGALVDLLNNVGTNIYVRGVRNSTDFDYEQSNFFINKTLKKDIIEIFIPCDQDKLHISSTMVRTLKELNKPYEQYLPNCLDKSFTI